jgi:hypothetical protein
MKLNLLRHMFILFTLFSLLGQGVMANGYSIMPTQAENMTISMHAMHSMQGSQSPKVNNDTNTMAIQADINCHDSALNMGETPAPNCCDGPHKCNLDCNHCLSLAMTATLLTLNINIPKLAPQTSLSFVRHDLSSQAPSPAFRPPII